MTLTDQVQQQSIQLSPFQHIYNFLCSFVSNLFRVFRSQTAKQQQAQACTNLSPKYFSSNNDIFIYVRYPNCTIKLFGSNDVSSSILLVRLALLLFRSVRSLFHAFVHSFIFISCHAGFSYSSNLVSHVFWRSLFLNNRSYLDYSRFHSTFVHLSSSLAFPANAPNVTPVCIGVHRMVVLHHLRSVSGKQSNNFN